MTPKISVIIPVYNTGIALKKCVNSILNQSFTDFECLLVNDGSTDIFTIEFCLSCQKQDKRVKYFEKKNEGTELTRVYGIKKAKGDYIIFSDHDDYYELNAFQTLYDNGVKSDADIVVANAYLKYNGIPFRKKLSGIYEGKTIDNQDFLNNYYCNFFGINKFSVSLWGKLLRRNLLEYMQFECLGLNFMEDIILNLQIFPNASKILFIPNLIYTHVYGGLSSKVDVENVLNGYLLALDFRTKYLNKYKLLDNYGKYLYIELKNVLVSMIKKCIESKKYTKEEFVSILKNFKNTEQFKQLSLFYAGSHPTILKMENEKFEDIYWETVISISKCDFKMVVKKIVAQYLKYV